MIAAQKATMTCLSIEEFSHSKQNAPEPLFDA